MRAHLIDIANTRDITDTNQAISSLKQSTDERKVKQLSPFRYPGGKTWLVADIIRWILRAPISPSIFIEPFAGGGMAGLTIASHGLAPKVFMSEIDIDVAAVWQTIFHGTDSDINWLCKRIVEFDVTLVNVREVLASRPRAARTLAFKTIIKNRMQRGGIMAPGAGLLNAGDNGRGLRSRWYPETLSERIRVLRSLRTVIDFENADAFDIILRFKNDPQAFFFIDPPYTAGGKKAGKRLYLHSEVDHERLFSLVASVKGMAMLTYDDSSEVRALAKKHSFKVRQTIMKNTHHELKRELLILKI